VAVAVAVAAGCGAAAVAEQPVNAATPNAATAAAFKMDFMGVVVPLLVSGARTILPPECIPARPGVPGTGWPFDN
jgi:hypothetical protein